MLRILIADDMPMQVHMLEAHLRQVRPEDELLTARNGEEVVQQVTAQQVDLVLSDIRMPQMDGLEMLRRIRRISEHTLTVFITGYALFEYAQEALQQGAVDFLVKPIDYDELDEKLKGWAARIEAEKQARTSLRAQQVTMAFHKWFAQGMAGLTEDEAALMRGRLGCGWMMCVYVPGSSNADEVCAHLAAAMKMFLGHEARMMAMPMESHRRFLVLQGSQGMESALKARLSQEAEQLNVRIGVSGHQADLLLMGKEAAAMCRDALNAGFYQEEAVTFSSVQRHSPSPTYPQPTDWQRWVMGSEKACRESVDRMQETLRAQRPDVAGLLESAMILIAQTDERIDPEKQDVAYLSTCSAKLRDALSWKQYDAALREGVDNLTRKAHATGSSGADPIRHCVVYLQSHLGEQLSLGAMAEMYYLSPNYFSALFKKKMGQGFVEYLTDARLNKAAELLQHSDELIYQISEACGYMDARYFIRQFQRKFGMSPAQYRRIGVKENRL